MSAETLAGVNRRCAGSASRHTTVLILTSRLRTRNCCIVCTSSKAQCRSPMHEPAGLLSNPGISFQRHGKKCALRERLNVLLGNSASASGGCVFICNACQKRSTRASFPIAPQHGTTHGRDVMVPYANGRSPAQLCGSGGADRRVSWLRREC